MQRIDENTYIDDTLVTCAEYQLFIDEMREQRKYYQPDHWTSYKFPKGQAREPILGVLYSDAIVFGEWLTQRENNDWKYRLPIAEEANTFTIKPLELRLAGYWLNEGWAWIGPSAQKTYELAIENGEYVGPVQDLARGRATDLAKKILKSLGSDFDNSNDITDKIIALDVKGRDSRVLILFLSCRLSVPTLDFIDHNSYIELNGAYKKVREFFDKINIIADSYDNNKGFLDHSEMVILGDFLHNIQTKTSKAIALLNLALALNRNLTFRKKLKPVNLSKLVEIVDISQSEKLEDYINSLQNRISGRFPAFEGMRLVKERIR